MLFSILLQAKQIRENRKEEVLEQRRKTGKQGSPPHLIVSKPFGLMSYSISEKILNIQDIKLQGVGIHMSAKYLTTKLSFNSYVCVLKCNIYRTITSVMSFLS